MNICLEELEHGTIFDFMVPFNTIFRVFESFADLLALEELFVEKAGKIDRSLIIDVLTVPNTDDMLHAEVIEHLSSKC